MAVWSNTGLIAALNRMQIPFPVTFTLGPALDGHVLWYTLGLALLTTLAFGLAPALQASRADLTTALKEESGTTSMGGRKRRLQKALVVTQVALSLVLLIGAGLSLRSLFNANRIDPGFRVQGVAKASFSPRLHGYNAEQSRQFFQQLLERVRALPGVESAALASHLPLTFEGRNTSAAKEGQRSLPVEQWADVDASTVGPGYFKTMGIRILRGRGFEERDLAGEQNLVVLNETLAGRFWPGQDPVGKTIYLDRNSERWEVIGVARNAKYRTLGEAPRPFVYQGYRPGDYRDEVVVVRASGDPQSLLAALRQSARALDEKVPMTGLQTLEQATSVALLLPRAGASLFGVFGLLGLALASLGLYGVIAYIASQRTHEIGIRMALGAQHADILRLVVSQGVRLTLAGVALGLAGAFAATRVLSVILYGISPTDRMTFAAVTLVLLLTSITACYIPARRATKVDPIVALRHE
jgi:predicted permease